MSNTFSSLWTASDGRQVTSLWIIHGHIASERNWIKLVDPSLRTLYSITNFETECNRSLVN